MNRAFGLGVALSGTWLLWSGHTEVLLLSLGGLSVLTVLWISRRMYILDHEGAPGEFLLRMTAYFPWLVWEIVKANLDVAGRILNPRLPISPRVIRVRAGQAGDVGRVIYANSITLTPGTVSIETDGDIITVHALSAEAAEGVLTGDMDRKVSWLEGTL